MQNRDGKRPSKGRESILQNQLYLVEGPGTDYSASRDSKSIINTSQMKLPMPGKLESAMERYPHKKSRTLTKEMNALGKIELENQEAKEEEQGDVYIKNKIPLFNEMIQAIKFKFMAHRLLSSTRSFMYKNLTLNQFNQIDDKAWSAESSSKRQSKQVKQQNNLADTKENYNRSQHFKQEAGDNLDQRSCLGRLKKFFRESWVNRFAKYLDKKLPVLEPTSLKKITWDFINVFGMLIYAIQIPIFVTFSEHSQSLIHWIIIMSVPLLVLLDLIFCLNTGCYYKGGLIKKRGELFRINFHKAIIPNLIIIASYALFVALEFSSRNIRHEGNTQWANILLVTLIMKLQDFGTIVSKLQEHTIITKKYRNIIGLFKLILTIVYIGHLIACLWINVAQIELNANKKTWLKEDAGESFLWYSLYIKSFYFTMVTMTTVGYGDYVPVNEVERTVAVFIIVFSSGVFAYSMNTIGSILQSFNEYNVKKSRNMSIINSYMTRKNVSTQMKNSIREYLDFYWQEESERDQESEEKIINLLSDNLKKNLLVESKNVVLKKSAIFRNYFSDDVKEKIVPLIREYRCSPEEIICLEGEQDDCSIYFIEKGSVEIFIESNSLKQGLKAIASLGKGSSFGEVSFFTGKARGANIRSREFTTLLILNREEFLQILVNYKEDYEKFCMIRDSLDFYDNYSLINLSCLSCQSESHQIYKCPYSHFQANHSRLRQMFSFCPNQERGKYSRKQNRRSNSRFNRNTVKEIAEGYQEEHDESIDYLNWLAFEKENISRSNLDNSENHEEEIDEAGKDNNDLLGGQFSVNVNYVSPKNKTIDEISENDEEENKHIHYSNTEDIFQNELREQKMKKIIATQSQKDFAIPEEEEDEGDGNDEMFQDHFGREQTLPVNAKNSNHGHFNFMNTSSPEQTNKWVEGKYQGINENINKKQKPPVLPTSLEQNTNILNELTFNFELFCVLPSSFEDRDIKKPVSIGKEIKANNLLGSNNNTPERTQRIPYQQAFKKEDPIPMRKKEKRRSNKVILQMSGKRIEALRALMGNSFTQPNHMFDSGIAAPSSPKRTALKVTASRSQGKRCTLVGGDKKMTFFNKTRGAGGIVGLSSLNSNINKDMKQSESRAADFKKIKTQMNYSNNVEGLEMEEEDLEQLLKLEQQAAAEYVEDNFDVMQNFINYFPLNNVDYQIELLGMTKQEKRRKMIWNSYSASSAARVARQKAREPPKKKMTMFGQTNSAPSQIIEEKRKSRFFGGSPKSKKLTSLSSQNYIYNLKSEKEEGVSPSQLPTTQQSLSQNHPLPPPLSLASIESSKKLTYQFSKRNVIKNDSESTKTSNKTNYQLSQPALYPLSLNSIKQIKFQESNINQISSEDNYNFMSFNQTTQNLEEKNQEDIYPIQQTIRQDLSYLDSLISSKLSNPNCPPSDSTSNEFNLRSKRVAYRQEDYGNNHILPVDDSRRTLNDTELETSQLSVSHIEDIDQRDKLNSCLRVERF